MQRVKAKAHSNIALIKYWGKRDESLILPYNSSLSLTLDKFYTITETEFIGGDSDIFILDGKEEKGEELKKISSFIDLFRNLAKSSKRVKVQSKNYFPTAAGLASSASGYACLAGCLNRLFGLNYSLEDLSKLARKGSGSATRSVYGGLVEWQKGEDDDSSKAVRIDKADWDIGMLAIIVDSSKKHTSSRIGMSQTVKTCPFYPAWVESAKEDLVKMKVAIKNRDLDQIGKIAEFSALKMHATMMATDPSVIYLQDICLKIIERIKELRNQGVLAYFTIDAGPNIKVITDFVNQEKVKEALKDIISLDRMIYSKPGPDLVILEEE